MTGSWPTARLYSVDGNASNVIYNNITLVPRKTIGPAPVNKAKARGVTVQTKRVRQDRKSAARKQSLADKYFAAWDEDELDD
tara:strand:- start:209 stop:454 length:246 start_codon:yes stop_codon:yes gene_type:complete